LHDLCRLPLRILGSPGAICLELQIAQSDLKKGIIKDAKAHGASGTISIIAASFILIWVNLKG